MFTRLIGSICLVAREVRELRLAITSSLEWFKSHANLATKDDLKEMLDTIMATEAEIQDALAQIDSATTKIGLNVAAEASVVQTVSDEMDALIVALGKAGVSPELVAQAKATAAKAQAASDALDQQVPILQAIASKGAANPVPIAPAA